MYPHRVIILYPVYFNGVPDKLTHAGIYGIDVSMDTLGMLYDISLDDYFRVNFAGFIKIIDALGGVDMNVEASFSDRGYSFTQDDAYER